MVDSACEPPAHHAVFSVVLQQGLYHNLAHGKHFKITFHLIC